MSNEINFIVLNLFNNQLKKQKESYRCFNAVKIRSWFDSSKSREKKIILPKNVLETHKTYSW